MRVIAIDPGYDRLGVAVMENTSEAEVLLYSTCIESARSDTLPDRLLTIGNCFVEIVKEYKPDSMAIETLFFNKNIKTAIGVAQARGTLLYLAKQSGCAVYEFGPQEIKTAVTGYGKSDKKGVIDMIIRLVKNAPLKALDDEYDAIAIGVTCLATFGRNR
ncbi:MAG: crossover junction endodeoxyribonuclease RuvC [Candidatus Pacebacteria bacterium]|nr:crossover junction endodeoxyribonuclease RuvC [Candidatus Paceibacterota bacterium]MBP9842962.1 crossover junction endodeoxyribonuclease RuvC [Candidatus Paceibacterota bacterium]